MYNSTNCLDCKYNNKYVNYQQTECIDEVPEGFYVNSTDYNKINKCHPKCKTCNNAPINNDMNCLTCPQGYYLIENTNNCQEYPYPGHYLDDDKLKKCHKNCFNMHIWSCYK